MPRFPDFPGIVRIILNGTATGQPWAAVQYGAYIGPIPLSSAEAGAIALGTSTAWNNSMAAVHNSSVSLTLVKVQDLVSVTGAVAENSQTHPGTMSGTALPLNTAAVTSYLIQARYRGGHPRTYWPAGSIASVHTDNRSWTSAFQVSMEAAIAGYISAMNQITVPGGRLTFSAVSWYQGRDANGRPVLRPQPLAFPVVGSAFHSRLDTMRRRLGKEGA